MSSETNHRAHNAVLDFLLVVISIGALVGLYGYDAQQILTGQAEQDHYLLAKTLGIPLGYVLLTLLLAGTRFAVAGRRAYMLSFINGLMGMGYIFHFFIEELSTFMLGATSVETAKWVDLIVTTSRELGMHLLLPILSGIAIYVVCSVFEREEGSAAAAPQANVDFSRVAQWIETTDAPEIVKQMLTETTSQVDQLRESYADLADGAGQAHAELEAASRSAQDLRRAFSEISSASTQFTQELERFRREMLSATAQADQVTTAIGEIKGVVNEFAEIASHNIFHFSSGERE